MSGRIAQVDAGQVPVDVVWMEDRGPMGADSRPDHFDGVLVDGRPYEWRSGERGVWDRVGPLQGLDADEAQAVLQAELLRRGVGHQLVTALQLAAFDRWPHAARHVRADPPILVAGPSGWTLVVWEQRSWCGVRGGCCHHAVRHEARLDATGGVSTENRRLWIERTGSNRCEGDPLPGERRTRLR